MEKIYKMIADRIAKSLEAGVVPWRKPWKGGAAGAPRNLITGKAYRGANVWTLILSGFSSPYWLTLRQANELGGRIKKGSTGTPVIFWKFFDTKEESRTAAERQADAPKGRRAVMLRYYTVFNVEQCEGLQHPALVPAGPVAEFNPIEAAEGIVKKYMDAPRIQTGTDGAYYNPRLDYISMPAAGTFTKREEYYSTLFHELAHSTGHERRLKREGVADGAHRFGDPVYSKEELVAEFTAAFLCGVAGIEQATLENSAAYIASWRRTIEENPAWIVCAAGAAQKAADYIQGIKYEEKKAEEPAPADAAAELVTV